MSKKVEILDINGVKLLAAKGLVENELYVLNDDVENKITINSAAYENDYNEFMFDDTLDEDLKVIAENLLDKASERLEEIDGFKIYTLKKEFNKKLFEL